MSHDRAVNVGGFARRHPELLLAGMYAALVVATLVLLVVATLVLLVVAPERRDR